MTDGRGLYRKYIIGRTDHEDEAGGRHEGCDYFVLDLTHDPHARAAIAAYAEACARDRPRLAADLQSMLAGNYPAGKPIPAAPSEWNTAPPEAPDPPQMFDGR